MNVVGIEYRPTYTVAALREAAQPPRILGDGHRSVIPNCILGDSWGSEAAATTESSWNGVSTQQPNVEHWRRLHSRLKEFTGCSKIRSADFQTVLVLSDAIDQKRLANLATQAEFRVDCVISPPQAAVASWLVRQASTPAAFRTVVAVTIGDISVEAAVFSVRIGDEPAISQSATVESCLHNGAGFWSQQLVKEILAHTAEQTEQLSGLHLWQAAMEAAQQMRLAPPESTVYWNGPLNSHWEIPSFTTDEVFGWPKVAAFSNWLRSAMKKLLAAFRLSEPDVLLISGVGADWPLSAFALTDLPPTVFSDPSTDIAIGATYWLSLPTVQPTKLTERSLPPAIEQAANHRPPSGSSNEGRPIQTGDSEFDRLLRDELNDTSPDSNE